MKIVILGAGIAGVTTAYFLAKAGNEVVVLEKNPKSSMGCSYANGGQLSFSHIEPWNSGSSLIGIFKNLLSKNSFITFGDKKDWEFYKWAWDFLKNSRKPIVNKTAENLFKLAIYSKANLANILREEKIDFNYKNDGILRFYRHKKTFDKAVKQAESEKSLGVDLEILNSIGCVKKEQTLVKLLDEHLLAGGIFYKNDASGDCAKFTEDLAEICQKKLGVVFEYNTQIKNIFTNYKSVTGINTDNGVFTADHYVSCLGSYGNSILKGVGIDTKIYPIKGYSLSIPTDKSFLAPNLSITDSENKIVYSRLGNIFRAAGTIEISGMNDDLNPKNIEFLKNTMRSTFSDFGNLNKASEWFGYRPYTSNCLPIACKIQKYGNLFLNSGHGPLGWTNNFATSKIITNLIIKDSKNPEFGFLEGIEKGILV